MPRLKPTRVLLAVLCCVAASSAFTMMGPTGNKVGRFDFGYELHGKGIARPLQVFDDGEQKTYFQFHPDDPTPVVLEHDGRTVLVPTREGPFTVVDSLARDFTLVMGGSRALVRHQTVEARMRGTLDEIERPVRLAALGGGLPAGMVLAKGTPAVAPQNGGTTGDLQESSYATPVKGDVIEWRGAGRTVEQPVLFIEGGWVLAKEVKRALVTLAGQIGPEARVIVIGREDSSMKDGLAERRAGALRDALVHAGVPAANIVAQIGSETGEPVKRGAMRLVASTIRWTPISVVQAGTAAPAQPSVSPSTAGAAVVTPQAQAQAQTQTQLQAQLAQHSNELVNQILADMVKAGRLSADGAQQIKAQRAAQVRTAPPAAATAKAPSAPGSIYELRVADGTVGEAMTRWARASGHEVVWEAPRAPLIGEAKVVATDFLDAVRQVVTSLRKAGYPIKARAYADGVVQVTEQ